LIVLSGVGSSPEKSALSPSVSSWLKKYPSRLGSSELLSFSLLIQAPRPFICADSLSSALLSATWPLLPSWNRDGDGDIAAFIMPALRGDFPKPGLPILSAKPGGACSAGDLGGFGGLAWVGAGGPAAEPGPARPPLCVGADCDFSRREEAVPVFADPADAPAPVAVDVRAARPPAARAPEGLIARGMIRPGSTLGLATRPLAGPATKTAGGARCRLGREFSIATTTTGNAGAD
jgi:hypothetical protein